MSQSLNIYISIEIDMILKAKVYLFVISPSRTRSKELEGKHVNLFVLIFVDNYFISNQLFRLDILSRNSEGILDTLSYKYLACLGDILKLSQVLTCSIIFMSIFRFYSVPIYNLKKNRCMCC